MKATEFLALKTIVAHADEQSEVWWAGYLFMNLSSKQSRELMDILETKPFIKPATTLTGKDALMFPSGIMMSYK